MESVLKRAWEEAGGPDRRSWQWSSGRRWGLGLDMVVGVQRSGWIQEMFRSVGPDLRLELGCLLYTHIMHTPSLLSHTGEVMGCSISVSWKNIGGKMEIFGGKRALDKGSGILNHYFLTMTFCWEPTWPRTVISLLWAKAHSSLKWGED